MTTQTYDFRKEVDFILSHLDPPLFPRNIMTQRLGYQMEVYTKDAMLRYFEHSDYQDCRISAYPKISQFGDFQQVAPSLVMIDLDRGSSSNNSYMLIVALKTTLKHIWRILRVNPTVLWTGNGYHIYLPIRALILEREHMFVEFSKSDDCDLSSKFLRFAEKLFSNGKHDPHHRPSVNSCLLRVPGTYNSKNGERVKIVQQWDRHRSSIQEMFTDFRVGLIEEELAQINAARKISSRNISGRSSDKINWIERLLQTPIADHRKYCLWRIMAPYFVNVRRLSDDESDYIVRSWLINCSKLRRLEGRPSYSLRYNLNNARKIGYYPISFDNLKKENPGLYDDLMRRGNRKCGQ